MSSDRHFELMLSTPREETEELERSSALHAVVAEPDLELKAGHIYVIPPGTSMSVVRGRIQLKPRNDEAGLPMPIDDLLDSVAADQRSNGVGVILSGSGSDGAIGLQRLKECGGTSFAQDEASAIFGSMPRAATSLGCVDSFLSPADIGRELARLAANPYLLATSPPDSGPSLLSDELLARLLKQLHSACDVDFVHYKRGTLERRIARRVALQDATSAEAYLELCLRLTSCADSRAPRCSLAINDAMVALRKGGAAARRERVRVGSRVKPCS